VSFTIWAVALYGAWDSLDALESDVALMAGVMTDELVLLSLNYRI